MQLSLTIPGEPMGKQRHQTGKGREFTPKKTVNYETLVKELWVMTHPTGRLDGQIGAKIEAFYTIPASDSNIGKQRKREGKIRPTKKPDTDNIAKIVLDALNTIAYRDDSCIVHLEVDKFYSDNPRVELQLWEIEP